MRLYKFAKHLMVALLVLLCILLTAGWMQPVCMALAFFLAAACLLLYWLQKPLWLRANRQEPLVCVEATLVNHRQQFSGRGVPRYEKSFLTFETKKGELLDFEVSREEFDRIQLGAKGLLAYRGRMYVSFRKPVAEQESIHK